MNWTWLLLVVPVSLAANQLALVIRRRWLRSEYSRLTVRITLLITALACFVAAFFNVMPFVMNGRL